MKKLYFKYGNGKTADLCQTAYNYREGGAKVITMNTTNRPIISHIKNNGKDLLTLEPDAILDNNIFSSGFKYKAQGIDAILIDNAHLLTENQVDQFFYLGKTFDITIIAYGNRFEKIGYTTAGAMRLMELANVIEPVDGENSFAHRANLQFYYGAMNSSKTAKLLYKAFNLEAQGLKVITIKPTIDRSATMIKSRIGIERKADIVLNENDRLYGEGVYMVRDHVNFILVDEAQFLTVDQIDDLVRINKEYNIPIRCYGLKTDFLTHHFAGSGRLLALADELKKMRTICHCAERAGADFNARKYKDGEYIVDGPQVAVDNGKEIVYDSLCDECYIRDVQGIELERPNKVLVHLMKKGIVK
ncbi:MAG: hypothetical protein IJB71_03305 [Bacilli bacterium]|nr:hypothetical protein [Bacilli bacterium]